MNQTLGERLRLLRGDRTQAEVAKAVGISNTALSMYERGERRPGDKVKIRLSKLYGVSIEKLFFAD